MSNQLTSVRCSHPPADDWERWIAAGQDEESEGRSRFLDRFLQWFDARHRGMASKTVPDRGQLLTLTGWTVADVYGIFRADRLAHLASASNFLEECEASLRWTLRFREELERNHQWLERRSARGTEPTIDQEFLDLVHRVAKARVRVHRLITPSEVAASANRGLVQYLGKASLPRRPTHLLRLQQRLVRHSLARQLRKRQVKTLDPADLNSLSCEPDALEGDLARLQQVAASLVEAFRGGDVERGLSESEFVAFHDRYLELKPRPTQQDTADDLGVTPRIVRIYLKKAERKVAAEVRRREDFDEFELKES